MTQSERAQLAAAMRQIEALEQQAEAMRHMAQGLKEQVSGLFLGATVDGEAAPSAPPPPAEAPKYYGSRKVASRADVMPEPAAT